MKKTADVTIVGAGPAGSFLAYLLAKEKIKVILIDKEKFPREKVCAGGLTPKVLKILPFNLKPLIEGKFSSVYIFYKNYPGFIKKYHRPLVYTVNRAKFDYFLVNKAQKAGAEFLPQHEVKKIIRKRNNFQIQAGHQFIETKIIVGADGANSFVAKFIGFKPDSIDIALQYEIPRQNKQKIKTITMGGGLIPHGYAWVFPNKQFLEVGVGAPQKIGKKVKAYLEDWVKVLDLNHNHLPLKGHPLTHCLRQNFFVKKKIILIGEAAGLNNPLTGEGIFYALRSAQMAALHLKSFFNGKKNALKNYEKDINEEILPELRAANFLIRILPFLLPLLFRLAKRNDYYWLSFFQLIRGDKTFLEVKSQLRPERLIKKIYALKRATSISSK